MGVSLFSTYLKQKKDLHRAYKKIDNIHHQLYYATKKEADLKQAELDLLAQESTDWKLKNIFIQCTGVRENCIGDTNIGIRHVYLRLNKVRKGSDRYAPSIQVSISKSNNKQGVIIKDFSLSTSGWPNALHEAITFSFNESVTQSEKVTLNDALAWADRNEDKLAEYLWKMISDSKKLVIINSEFSRNSTIMYTRLKINTKGALVLATTLPHTNRSKTITDYDSLFQFAAYFTALQLIHREFDNEGSYASHAAGIYFLLKGEWLTLLASMGIDHRANGHEENYDFIRFKELVNQWCDLEYGQHLLP